MAKTIHPVSVRLPEDLYQILVERAEKSERSVSSQIIYLIRQALIKEAEEGTSPA